MWKIERGQGALVATAIHAGSALREELLAHVALAPEARLREEDPFTDQWTVVAPNRVVVETSRFEMDLNRPRDKAVYLVPEDAWGLQVWASDLPEPMLATSLSEYDGFYDAMAELFSDLAAEHGRFVVFDLHSYNHRRGGPQAPYDPVEANPQVNVGTGTMLDRSRFAPVIESFIETLRGAEFPGGPLDVRENVKFRGGQLGRWAHATYPESACVLSIELKKFFMDEWTGQPDAALLGAIRDALASTVQPVLAALETVGT